MISRHAFLFVLIFLITDFFIWYTVWKENRGDLLTVTFLNIGQGDAIFMQAPNGNQVLVDAGPSKTVLRELGKVMPFYDRTIDVMIVTNPDTDHMAGFIDVLQRYEVSYALESGTISNTSTYKELSNKMNDEDLTKLLARRGMVILIDAKRSIYLQVLFPDRDVSGINRNDGSIMMKLVYGKTSFMFTGDAPVKMERYLISLEDDLKSTILKVGHHGSKTSTSIEFARAVSPELAVISAGKNNRYGHPHKEVISVLENQKIPYLITGEHGRVVTTSDGFKVEIKR